MAEDAGQSDRASLVGERGVRRRERGNISRDALSDAEFGHVAVVIQESAMTADVEVVRHIVR